MLLFKVNSEAKKKLCFFAIGGVGYGIIELMWRGYTHWTMILAGGVCFVIFSEIADKFRYKPLIYKVALAALGVTAVEFIFGIVFNLIFKMNVWDYSEMPFNLFGQICPLFTLAWGVVALIFIPLADVLNKVIGGEPGS